MLALAPCPHCKRHVRTGSNECPFCTGALDGIPVQKPPIQFSLHRRGAILFMGATLAALGASCSDSDDTGGKNQALDSGQAGAGGTSSGGSSGSTASGGSAGSGGGPIDEGGVGDAYGLPPFDGEAGPFGETDSGAAGAGGGPVDEGGLVDAYGTPDGQF
jgi:hypothetical protein